MEEPVGEHRTRRAGSVLHGAEDRGGGETRTRACASKDDPTRRSRVDLAEGSEHVLEWQRKPAPWTSRAGRQPRHARGRGQTIVHRHNGQALSRKRLCHRVRFWQIQIASEEAASVQPEQGWVQAVRPRSTAVGTTARPPRYLCGNTDALTAIAAFTISADRTRGGLQLVKTVFRLPSATRILGRAPFAIGVLATECSWPRVKEAHQQGADRARDEGRHRIDLGPSRHPQQSGNDE